MYIDTPQVFFDTLAISNGLPDKNRQITKRMKVEINRARIANMVCLPPSSCPAAKKKKRQMAGKIKLALEALEDGLLYPEPFSALCAPDSIRARLQLARRALRLIAGEDEGSPNPKTPRYYGTAP